MPVLNIEEAEYLSNPLAPRLIYEADQFIKENLVIGDLCEANEHHVGLYYQSTDICVECEHTEKHSVPMLCALSTYLNPELHPDNFSEFIGKFDFDRDNLEVFFGKACDSCGNNLRYSADKRCVFCTGMRLAELEGVEAMRRFAIRVNQVPLTMHYDRFLRAIADYDNLLTYNGAKCKKCAKNGITNHLRYTLRGQCVSCVNEQNKKRAATSFPAAAPDATDYDSLF